MSDERELERHNGIIDRINNASTREELPNISFATIASYLATNVYFNNQKLSQTLFKPVIDELLKHGLFSHEDVRFAFIRVLLENYSDISEEQIIDKYNEVLTGKRMNYLLNEIMLRNEKLNELEKKENLERHNNIIKQINQAYEIKDLPKVGLSELNKRILRAINDNSFSDDFKTGDIRKITEAYLENKSFIDIEDLVIELCSKQELSDEDKKLMSEQIIGSLILDETIEYIAEEIKLKDARKTFIYKYEHEETMEAIKEAHRISQLPPNLTFSTLTSYLNGNTTIYSNDDRIKSEDLKILTELLFNNAKWEDEEVISEVKRIVDRLYPEKEDAFELLFLKLSSLPKTYYLVEEIKYSLERQKEFIGNNCSNVNVYFIPNEKSPMEGGRFYNCYINRVGNLDLSQILPLDLEEIVPPSLDIDSVEWYVQEKYDSTFKVAGGIILNRDETIGNVNVFRPNDGKVGVTPEEKAKMDQISDLDKQIEEKEKRLAEVEGTLNEKERKSSEIDEQMKRILQSYERKALELQMELLNQIKSLKQGLIPDAEEAEKANNGEGKGLK